MIIILEQNKIYLGDNLELLKQLDDNSIHSCVSDFPYNLGFMGKKWDTIQNYYQWNYDRAIELLRVLKPGGYCLIFGGCYDEKTECLTKNGWKYIKDVTKEDLIATLNPNTNTLEYNYPKEIVKQIHNGKMYHFKTNKIDLLVTDNHKMYVSTIGTDKYHLKRADECINKSIKMKKNCFFSRQDVDYFIIPSTTQSNGHNIIKIPEIKIPMDLWLKFFGLWIAQGSASIIKCKTGYNYKTQICHFNLKKLYQLQKEMSPYFKVNIYEHYGKFVINNKQLTEYLSQFGKANEKFIPINIKNTSPRQLKIFIEWYLEGDGDRNSSRMRAYTTSKKLVDDLQEIALLIGLSADYSIDKARKHNSKIKRREINKNFTSYTICFNQKQNEPLVYSKKYNVVTEIQWNDFVYCVEVPNHILYVRRNGKTAWCGNTRTHHRLVCAFEDAGFQIKDEMQWIYGSGFPKTYNISKGFDKKAGAERKVIGSYQRPDGTKRNYENWNDKHFGVGEEKANRDRVKGNLITSPSTELAKQWDGWGTALKPAQEPIMVAQKPIEKNYCYNIEKYGVGGINIDDCRVPYEEGGTLATNPSLRTHINGGNDGNIIAHEDNRRVVIPNKAGRFPANIILDEEAAKMLDKQTGILKSGKDAIRKNPNAKGYHGNWGVGQIMNTYGDEGGASRFFYCAKASKKDRTENNQIENKHPTVKPTELVKYLVKLVTPSKGICLDVCEGSGTHVKAILQLNKEGFDFNYIGFENNEESYNIACQRENLNK